MTDENKTVEEEKHTCLCRSKGFRKFLIVTGGTFVGVFLALSLFAALHKPPMPAPCPMQMMPPCPCHQMARPDFGPQFGGPQGVPQFGPQNFDRGPRGDFHKKINKDNAQRPMPPRAEVPAPQVNR